MTDKEKAKTYLDAYDRVFRLFQMNNDNYFKRTQILMIVIQSALFVAFTKLAWNPEVKTKCASIISLGVIAVLGILSAWAWTTLITRQHDVLEFCRCYLRGIETSLMKLGIPLGCFTYEKRIFHRDSRHDAQQFVHFTTDQDFTIDRDVFPFPLRTSRGTFADRLWEVFPHKNRKVKIRLMNIERWIARSLVILWSSILILLIMWGTAHKSDIKEWLESIIVPQDVPKTDKCTEDARQQNTMTTKSLVKPKWACRERLRSCRI